MTIYKAPVEDVLFLLNDVFQVERYNNLPGFADAPPDVMAQIFYEAAKFAEQVLLPINAIGDQEGCTRHPDGAVTTPSGFKDAYRKMCDAGWVGVTAPAAWGGQGLPETLGLVVREFFGSANMAFNMYPGLVQGAVATILGHGSEQQQKTYVPNMVSGRWAGTMCLTEPHCGTDLGLLRTKAVQQADGSYQLTGTKIFISGGEQDLSENIVHLVIARIEGAPAGTKGISLFVAPKFLVNDDGSLGARNAISCGAIEHKMGIRGSSTCVMNFDGATAWLVGEANKGLVGMFTMMNRARIAVGVQGLAMSEIAYQNAAAYAKDRLQGRAITGPAKPDQPADPIIVHADVRRMLLQIRAFNEAARALVFWSALKAEIGQHSTDAKERADAEDHLGLLTPVIKGVLTDLGFANTVTAQQVFGGHGYIREWGVEQFVRDARIPMIYEGTNGIQALDLVGRKLGRDGGRALMTFMTEIQDYMTQHGADPTLRPHVVALGKAVGDLQQATMWFMQNGIAKPDNAAAGATDYLHLFGLVALGYMWCRIVAAADRKLAADGDAPPLRAKITTARFFFERMLPETALRLARITAGGDSVMALPAEAF